MRILIHDFGGYPFPIQLSREMARRGHDVMHAYCGSLKTTPGGDHVGRPDDPPSLRVQRVMLDSPLDKYSFVRRWRQENEYGRRIVQTADAYQPDLVVSANTPLDAQVKLHRHCRKHQTPFVFWLQDVLSIATDRLLRKKIPIAGGWIGAHYLRMESKLLRCSDLCLTITDAFEPLLRNWGVASDRIVTMENWAPINELPTGGRNNPWSRRHGLHTSPCVIYTGTMGMKHNPDLLLQAAVALRDHGDIAGRGIGHVVVVSEGIGADWLSRQSESLGLTNLIVLPYGPFEQVPDVMATADVLVAVLEPDAGVYSVPSKVLAYLCAGRPLVLSIPPENLAAKIVLDQAAGCVVPPGDTRGFIDRILGLLDDPTTRDAMGSAGRQYAEKTFDIVSIADHFESAISSL